MDVTVVQHAEKERVAGDPGLTPQGHRQAEATAAHLSSRRIDALWSSPLLRARQTAEPLAAALSVDVEAQPLLTERMNWDGSQTLQAFLAEWERATMDRQFVPTVGESSQAAGERFIEAVRTAYRRFPDGRVVFVSHGGVTIDGLRSITSDEALARLFPAWRAGVPACGLTRVSVGPEGMQPTTVGSVAHLSTGPGPTST